MPNYRITAQRWDIHEHVILTLTNVSEDEAKEEFERLKASQSYSWDYLKLIQFEEEVIATRDPDKKR